ncbi:plastocyanin [Ideonella sp. DXS29W]|uniref:Plastocyanin n=1 Tax=Ideonella lacteola TaxID=2984193 RepID=A0ABU9BS64_9BURK
MPYTLPPGPLPRLAAMALALTAAAAQAGTLDVQVLDRDGQPAADVVVLIQVPNQPAPKPAAAPVVISQENLRFQPFLTVVPLGSTLRFVNKDTYDHHVRSVPSGPLGSMPAVEYFELRLDGTGAPPRDNSSYGGYDDYNTKPAAAPKKKSGTNTVDVKAEHAGPIGLGCHIHGSMRGQVYVSGTSWFGKTDAKGTARIEGVPDGAAELVVWHPDQLQDQAPVKIQVGAAPAKLDATLNFTPKRRRS